MKATGLSWRGAVAALALGEAGVLVGMLAIPLGGGNTVRLGLASGTLLVALVLGRLERSGGISWAMSLAANLTMRQIGLLLFLAGVGTRAGYSFLDTLHHSGAQLLLAGALVTFVVTLVTLIVERNVLGVRFESLMGLVSGVQTQPACLAYADGLTRSDAQSVAYAAIYPTAMIVKTVVAQLLLG